MIAKKAPMILDVTLDEFMGNRGLRLGQFGYLAGMRHDDYFNRFGLSEEGFNRWYSMSEDFRDELCYLDLNDLLNGYARHFDMPVIWRPSHLHLLNVLAANYPDFKWAANPSQKRVGIEGMPILADGGVATIHELASGRVIMYKGRGPGITNVTLQYQDDGSFEQIDAPRN